MDYTINRVFPNTDFDEVDSRVRTALAAQGFGALTEIDVAATMKKKINQDMAPYRILKRFAFNLTHSLPLGSSSRTLWA